jgi:putative membrane protein
MTLVRIALLLIGALHLGFLVLEMFLWTTPAGLRIFGLGRDLATATRTLALNQGLYNGFLAAGLIWASFANRRDLAAFFLACVAIAGIVGAVTVNRRVFYVQALPAMLALGLVLVA